MSVENDLQSALMLFHINNMPKKTSANTVYHYTTSEGLLSIINNQKLWFTRYDCLNDYSEGIYILEVFTSVCKNLRDSNEISQELYDALVTLEIDNKGTLPHKDEAFHYGSFDVEYYVCCFSKEPDSLPMWNYYSKNDRCEGYNIEFELDLMEYSKCQERNYCIQIYEMIYDRNEQEVILKNAILELISIVKSSDAIDIIKSEITEFLKRYSLSFKKKCFEHEKEIRAVLTIPKDGNEHYKVQYRSSNGSIVPYVEYSFEKEFLCGVTIGPLVDAAIAQKTLWQLLKQNGYRFDSIELSDVPVRF